MAAPEPSAETTRACRPVGLLIVMPATAARRQRTMRGGDSAVRSNLPVAVVWQSWDGRGWGTGWQSVIGGALALAASGLVIVTHHLGYRTFRSRRMLQPVFGCLVLSLGYLLRGNPISAMGGHVLLHLGMLNRRM